MPSKLLHSLQDVQAVFIEILAFPMGPSAGVEGFFLLSEATAYLKTHGDPVAYKNKLALLCFMKDLIFIYQCLFTSKTVHFQYSTGRIYDLYK